MSKRLTKIVSTNVFANKGKSKYEIKGPDGTTLTEYNNIADVISGGNFGTRYGLTEYYNDSDVVIPAGDGTRQTENAKLTILRSAQKAVVLEGKLPKSDTDLTAIFGSLSSFGTGTGNDITNIFVSSAVRKLK